MVDNIDSDKKVEVSFRYKYDEGTPEWYLTQYVWVESAWWSLIDSVWWNFTETDPLYISTYCYNPDGTSVQLWNNRTIKANWSFDKNTNPIRLVMERRELNVLVLDNKEMVVSIKHGLTTQRIHYKNNGLKRFK